MLKELRTKGDARKTVIDSLIRRGFYEVDQIATMDRLANDIFLSLWKRIESSIPSDETEHQSVFSSLKGRISNLSHDLNEVNMSSNQTGATYWALE